jgi:hypothetical protein
VTELARSVRVSSALRLFGLALFWGCAPSNLPHSVPPAAGLSASAVEYSIPEDNPLYRAPTQFDFSSQPALRQLVAARVYNYFRFINQAFARDVCERFRGECARLPDVNLHGDAHLEQYVVTERGHGLSDFDNATVGPPLIDLLRFGVSLHLAATHLRWDDAGARAFDTFFAAYLEALTEPETVQSTPRLVESIRRQFDKTRERSLQRAEASLLPTRFGDDRAQAEMNVYAAALIAVRTELTLDFFRIKSWGALTTGIGSALDRKYLFIVEGPTPDREDDTILEAKVVKPLSDVPCVQSSEEEAPVRLLDSQARISRFPYQLAGYTRIRDPETGRAVTFWLHEWETHYVELSIDTSFARFEDLDEVARDVGYQLGRGHTRIIADPNESALKHSLRTQIGRLRQAIVRRVREMTWDVEQAAYSYRDAVGAEAKR